MTADPLLSGRVPTQRSNRSKTAAPKPASWVAFRTKGAWQASPGPASEASAALGKEYHDTDFAPKVPGRLAQGQRVKRAPPWVRNTMIQSTLKACGSEQGTRKKRHGPLPIQGSNGNGTATFRSKFLDTCEIVYEERYVWD